MIQEMKEINCILPFTPDSQDVKINPFNFKIFGFYIAASWNSPSIDFALTLDKLYKTINQNGQILEIIFISFDETQELFEKTRSLVPFPALKFKDKITKKILKELRCNSIPYLSIFKEGKEISCEGVEDIQELGINAFEKWLKMNNPVEQLDIPHESSKEN